MKSHLAAGRPGWAGSEVCSFIRASGWIVHGAKTIRDPIFGSPSLPPVAGGSIFGVGKAIPNRSSPSPPNFTARLDGSTGKGHLGGPALLPGRAHQSPVQHRDFLLSGTKLLFEPGEIESDGFQPACQNKGDRHTQFRMFL